jgi:hypothetical protein
MLDGYDALAFFVFFMVTYAYAGYRMKDEPDPATEFGISMNAAMAAVVGVCCTIITLLLVLATGKIGYVISIVLISSSISWVMKKMNSQDKKTTT